eukprot:scaffold190611_cov30-Tisochrysis_lutea.AAC.4
MASSARCARARLTLPTPSSSARPTRCVSRSSSWPRAPRSSRRAKESRVGRAVGLELAVSDLAVSLGELRNRLDSAMYVHMFC